ncbi:MAG: hypothetical protein ABIH18_08530 [Candidatus Omnitrophota bacterium]
MKQTYQVYDINENEKSPLHPPLKKGGRGDFQAKIISLFIIYCLLFTSMGCDAFVRKFTRKPKKDKEKKEELVLVPVEYNTEKVSKQDLYQQYFLFWKTWQEQLIDSLRYETNWKRSIGCASEAAGNLEQMQKLLKKEKQEELSPYVKQLRDLVTAMENDPYCRRVDYYLAAARRLKTKIQKKFSSKKIYLKKIKDNPQ